MQHNNCLHSILYGFSLPWLQPSESELLWLPKCKPSWFFLHTRNIFLEYYKQANSLESMCRQHHTLAAGEPGLLDISSSYILFWIKSLLSCPVHMLLFLTQIMRIHLTLLPPSSPFPSRRALILCTLCHRHLCLPLFALFRGSGLIKWGWVLQNTQWCE